MLHLSKGFRRNVVLGAQLIMTDLVVFSDQRPILPRARIKVHFRHKGLSGQHRRIEVAARWGELEPEPPAGRR